MWLLLYIEVVARSRNYSCTDTNSTAKTDKKNNKHEKTRKMKYMNDVKILSRSGGASVFYLSEIPSALLHSKIFFFCGNLDEY